jgi:Na+/H+ antiporter NhaD/arsenite permease-like protein
MLAPILIFAGTYLVIGMGRLPGFRVDRTGAAIIGATLMIAFNVLTLQEAYAAIDYDTIILLFGMMIVVANLRLSGFFRLVSAAVVEHAHRPILLLASIVFVSGILSAFFVNDTICLVLTPLVLEVTAAVRRNPVPFLLGVAMGANIGSVATITGNPQNMMIGSYSGISYRAFAAALAPVALVCLVAVAGVIALIYRREFREQPPLLIEPPPVRVNRVLLWKSLAVSAAMVAFFFAGWPVAKVAVVAGAVLLVTRRVKPEKVYRQIDWGLLVLFVGLFVVVHGVSRAGLDVAFFEWLRPVGIGTVAGLTIVSAVLSNLVSNVPAVMLFTRVVPHLPNARAAWLALAMSSTLAGNLTVLGSIANLIVVEGARRQGIRVSFTDYLRVGVPVTVLTLAAGVFWLSL